MLKYFYITNNPYVAQIAEEAGVDRIFVDMEYIGKELRQPNMDTVKNHHTVDDVKRIRKAISDAELLVRVNPIHNDSQHEIEEVVKAGADIIMLPMWKTVDEVKEFIDLVDGRTKTILLLETDDAVQCIDEVVNVQGIDEIHIGLNDLHLSQHKSFLFELVTDGTVDYLAEKIKNAGIPFGFGGVGRVNSKNAPLPAENILAEHYRLGSKMVILARAFCNSDGITDYNSLRNDFINGVSENRKYERILLNMSKDFFDAKHQETAKIVERVVSTR